MNAQNATIPRLGHAILGRSAVEELSMPDQEQPRNPSPSLQRLTQEVQARRLLMRERLRQIATAERADTELRPLRQVAPLYRLFSEVRE